MTFDGDGCVRTLRLLGMRLIDLTTTSVALSYRPICVSAEHSSRFFSETLILRRTIAGLMQDTLAHLALHTIDVNAHYFDPDHAICSERQYFSTKTKASSRWVLCSSNRGTSIIAQRREGL